MLEHIIAIRQVLEEEKNLLREMLSACERQIEAFKNNDLAALSAAVADLDRLSGAMAQLEEERVRIHRALAAALHLTPGATMREVVAALPDMWRGGLEKLHREMTALVRSLKSSNAVCRALSERALQFNRLLQQAIEKVQGTTYEAGGRVKPVAAGFGRLDKSV